MSCLAPPLYFAASRSLLAAAICMATLTPALADDGKEQKDNPNAAPIELGATEIANTRLGTTTEGTESYTTGAMSTATKLPMTMRETPQATTVITRQRMDDQAMTSINDVVKYSPGLFLSQSSGPGRQTYSSRGFDIDNLMYDGIPSTYEGWTVGAQPNLAMFDRVEIVRGATGLVTGSGNPSAAINLVRKRPLAEQKVTLTGAAGSWDDYRGEIDASSPLNDSGTLRGRVVTSYRDANSFVDNAEEDHGLFYAITEADLSDDTTLSLGFSHQKDKTNYFWGAAMVGLDGHHLDLPRSYNPGTDWENKDQEINTVFAEVRQRLANDWKLQVNASYTEQNAMFSGSYQSRWASDLSLGRTVYQSAHDENQAGVDAFASGPFEAFGRTHELVVGASKRIFDMTTHNYSPYDMYWPLSASKPDFVHTGNSRTVTTQEGVYATTRLSLADPLKLILGSRLDWYENNTSAPYKGTHSELKVTRHATKYAGLIYDLNDNHSVYVSYTDIFKPQSSLDTSGKTIAPITGENLELGIKGEYFDGALNASAAIFQIDQENRAKAITDQSLCPSYPATSCYEASGKVRSKGVELEVQGQLTPGWELAAGYTFAEAKYVKDAKKDNEGRLFDTDIPRHLFKMSTTYTLPGELDQWRVGTSLYHQNRIYNKGTTYLIEQDGYTLVDFMLGFKATEHLDARLNLNNAFNKKYYNSLSSSVTVPSNVYGDPRNLMLSVKYTY